MDGSEHKQMGAEVRFDYAGESLVAVIDPETRDWSLNGHILDPQAEAAALITLRGPEFPPPRSPADGIPWAADAREAAVRVNGTVTMPNMTEGQDEDVLY